MLLYSHDIHASDQDELFETTGHELSVSRKNLEAAWQKVEAIHSHLADIDAMIEQVSTSYDFYRIQKVELAVLRLSCYELVFEKKLVPSIVIAEAKRIAKKFATEDAATFCLALLDAMVKKDQPSA